jgi:hypothetical protein
VSTNRTFQGWAPDPFGLHESRYFSDGRPTKLVMDGGVESYDEPPSDTVDPAALAHWPGGSAAGAPPAASAASGSGPSFNGPDYVDSGFTAAGGRSRRGRYAAGVIIAAAAAAAGVLLVDRSSPRPSPVAFVTSSLQRMTAAKTADISVSGTIAAAGQSAVLGGTGQVNFATSATTISLSASSGGRTATVLRAVLLNGKFYIAVGKAGSSLGKLTGGREWIEVPASQSSGAQGSAPIVTPTMLKQPGVTVRTLGTRVVDGVNCTGYAVTPSIPAPTVSPTGGYTGSGVSTVTVAGSVGGVFKNPPTIAVWIDAQGFVHEAGVSLHTSIAIPANSLRLLPGNTPNAIPASNSSLVPGSGQNVPFSVNVTVDFTHLGTPVTITAPPPSDVTSLDTVLQNIGTIATH